MKRAKIGELKNNLSRYLDHVKTGGSVLVLDRDEPIARLVPLHGSRDDSSGRDRLAILERRGVVRRGTGAGPRSLGKPRRLKLRGSVLRELLRERESGW
ncbi:MAG TPA: type II toxin-antitoxin system prevent-host-death family antitoxin [Methylomirabilota bacterium]|nr:type II toxin-antitoxin system prevent-host-death family antitoxin [Methylomirabilota bacterium]